jgi:hypothetical protein
MWVSAGFTHSEYPDESIFSNSEFDFATQVRTALTASLMLVGDLAYSHKSYSDPTGASNGEVIADSATSTSIVNIDGGLLWRAGNASLLGLIIGEQLAPEQHARSLVRNSNGKPKSLASALGSLYGDDFAWFGPSAQFVFVQDLSADYTLRARLAFERRNYGAPSIAQKNRQFPLAERIDSRRTVELGIGREFSLSDDGTTSLSIDLNVGNVANSSPKLRAGNAANYDFSFNESYVELVLSLGMF